MTNESPVLRFVQLLEQQTHALRQGTRTFGRMCLLLVRRGLMSRQGGLTERRMGLVSGRRVSWTSQHGNGNGSGRALVDV